MPRVLPFWALFGSVCRAASGQLRGVSDWRWRQYQHAYHLTTALPPGLPFDSRSSASANTLRKRRLLLTLHTCCRRQELDGFRSGNLRFSSFSSLSVVPSKAETSKDVPVRRLINIASSSNIDRNFLRVSKPILNPAQHTAQPMR